MSNLKKELVIVSIPKSGGGQSGVSLYLSVVIMTMLLAIGLGVSTIFLGQLEVARSQGYSVIAFYAADAGIERILVNRANPSSISQTPLSNGATYEVFVTITGSGGCAASNYCIKSIGKYKETNRAIEISY